MAIRVIAGSAKGRKLRLVPGDTTRPIMDRVKESMFSILGDWVVDSRWLDLFAGTGSVGIEALSRGAEYCMFVDNSAPAIETIRSNLVATKLAEHSIVRKADSLALIRSMPTELERVEAIFVAPPQYKNLWLRTLEAIDENCQWLVEDGIVIVQIDPREYQQVSLKNLVLYDQRTYGNTLLCWFELSNS